MGSRPLLALSLGWLLVVVAVAVVTFVVVDRAGRGVGQASAARTVAPVPSADVSGTPGSTLTASPPGSGSAAPKPSRPGPTQRTESFSTEGGTVVASCDGDVVTLESITVRDDWRFEQESEHGELEVQFESRQENADIDDIEVHLACRLGVLTRVDG